MAAQAGPSTAAQTVIVSQAARPAPIGRRRYTRRELTPWLLVLPALIVFVCLFIIPMVMLFAQSFSSFSYATSPAKAHNEPTLANYIKFFTDGYYPRVLINTLRLGFLTVLFTIVLGFPFAYVLNQSRGLLRTFLVYTLLAPLLISGVVRSFGWIALLNTDGVVNHLLAWLRLTSSPVKLLYTDGAVIVGLVHVLLVFMVIPINESLRTIDPQLKLAASTLGANPWKTMRRVILPLAIPGIFSGSLIVFAITTSTFVTPRILGGSNVVVMGYLTIQENLVALNWPFGAALAFITLAVSMTLVIVAGRRAERASGTGVMH